MSLPTERWCVSIEPRIKQIDAELKEKLAPFGATRSARFRFAYDLAFAIVCGDHTSETIQGLLATFQQTNRIKSSYQLPAEVPIAGKKGTVNSPAVPLPIKGFQGGTHWEFESLLQHAAGMVQ